MKINSKTPDKKRNNDFINHEIENDAYVYV